MRNRGLDMKMNPSCGCFAGSLDKNWLTSSLPDSQRRRKVGALEGGDNKTTQHALDAACVRAGRLMIVMMAHLGFM